MRSAEVYRPAILIAGVNDGGTVNAGEGAEDVRVKGEVTPVGIRKGLDDAEAGGVGTGLGALLPVCTGGRDGGPTEVGRPPGVKLRLGAALTLRESTDWEDDMEYD